MIRGWRGCWKEVGVGVQGERDWGLREGFDAEVRLGGRIS